MGVCKNAWDDHLTMAIKNTEWAIATYEKTSARLPTARFPRTYEQADSLADIAESYDVFLLDAFGVLGGGWGQNRNDHLVWLVRQVRSDYCD